MAIWEQIFPSQLKTTKKVLDKIYEVMLHITVDNSQCRTGVPNRREIRGKPSLLTAENLQPTAQVEGGQVQPSDLS